MGSSLLNHHLVDSDLRQRLMDATRDGDAVGVNDAADDIAELLRAAGELNGATAGDLQIEALECVATARAVDDMKHPAPVRAVDIFSAIAAPALSPADFPKVLADFAFPLARAAGHDPGAYAIAALAAAAGAVDDGVRLLLDSRTSWFESARLWLLLLGGPGTAKTPAIRASMGAIFDQHRHLREQYARDVAAIEDKDEAARVPRPAVFANDATVEALSEILRDNPRGLLCVFEELDAWLGAHDAYRGGQVSKDRGEWLRLFDGGPHQVDRIKRGSVFVPNWGCSIVGATTPAGLRRHMSNLPPDGLIQRFLPVMVRPMVATDHNVLSAQVKQGREAFDSRVRDLFTLGPCTIRLSNEAAKYFADRRDQLRDEVQAFAAVADAFAAHIAKHAGLLGRLALLFHCLENGAAAREVNVSGETMQRADKLLRKLTRHAAALYEMLAGESGATDLARRLALSILAGKAESLTKNSAIQTCSAFRKADEGLQWGALTLLEDAGWLLPGDGRMYRGRPTSWAVNADVHVMFAERAQKHREYRQTIRNRITGADDGE